MSCLLSDAEVKRRIVRFLCQGLPRDARPAPANQDLAHHQPQPPLLLGNSILLDNDSSAAKKRGGRLAWVPHKKLTLTINNDPPSPECQGPELSNWQGVVTLCPGLLNKIPCSTFDPRQSIVATEQYRPSGLEELGSAYTQRRRMMMICCFS